MEYSIYSLISLLNCLKYQQNLNLMHLFDGVFHLLLNNVVKLLEISTLLKFDAFEGVFHLVLNNVVNELEISTKLKLFPFDGVSHLEFNAV